MNCYVSGILGLALLGGSISTLSITEEQHNFLRNVFSDELDKIYEKIITERRNHYILGLIIGIILSFIVLYNVRISNYFTRITLFFTITLGTAVVFYTIMPKSDYMLNHLKTSEENKKWLEVYRFMKTRYIMGLILGALAAIPLSNILC
jgi:hypothetical protein